ncbi:MAG TPA: sigma-70 family RNA polymerase sigma factor [Polyangiaceae bacterium]
MHAAAALREPHEAAAPPATGEARLRAMLDEHFDFVWRSLRRLGLPEHAADDGAQRVFVVASRRLADIEPGSERAFLFRTATHVASSERRTLARRREVLGEPPDSGEGATRPDELLDQRRARELLEQVLASLPLELRTVLVLFEFEELSIDEIAETIGIPRGTAASRLRRAREEFSAALARWKARSLRGEP